MYEKYDSIIAPIISHIAQNLIAIVLTQMEMFAWMIGNSVRVLIIVLICGVITIGVVRTIHKMDVTKVLKIYCKEKADDI